jgi:hypothetical protein
MLVRTLDIHQVYTLRAWYVYLLGHPCALVTYPEFEESEADLVRHQKWLAAIGARDYFEASGHADAVAAVEACERALAAFQDTALAAEFDEQLEHRERSRAAALRAVDSGG